MSVWLYRAYIKSDALLISPSSADFPFSDEFKITNMGNGEYIVTVDFEADNSYGVKLKKTFSVWIKGTGESNYDIIDVVGS